MNFTDRIKHAWNAFSGVGTLQSYSYGFSSSRPQYKSVSYFNTTSYVASIFNRIAIDVAMTGFKHVKIDPDNEDITDLRSGINECLTVEANIDQSHTQFIHDLAFSMFDEGVVAVVPVDTTLSPKKTGGYDILSMRVGKITQWFPKHVEVDVYNEDTGQNERIILEKKNVAIVENPLYEVVNNENSTLKRLIRKLNQLDNLDELASSNRLDLLITLPHAIKTQQQMDMAERRINEIEKQLASGRNGIAYIDATEKAIQLNRPVNSQLPETIRELNQQFYDQMGVTENIMKGTASEGELRTYYTRTIDPIVESILSEFNRKFITKTGRTQGQKIISYRDMFKMVPVETVAALGDTLRRNQIASANEVRKIIGLKPSNDPRADELFNPNIADKNQSPVGSIPRPDKPKEINAPGSLTSPDNGLNE